MGAPRNVEDVDSHGGTVSLPLHWKVQRVLIGELARRSGVSAKTLRYYEEIGLVDPPERSSSGYRVYGEGAVGRLAFIRSSQALGLSLGEIRGVIALRDVGETPCTHVVGLLRRRSAEIDRTIRSLRTLKGDLNRLVERAQQLDPPTVTVAACAISSALREA